MVQLGPDTELGFQCWLWDLLVVWPGKSGNLSEPVSLSLNWRRTAFISITISLSREVEEISKVTKKQKWLKWASVINWSSYVLSAHSKTSIMGKYWFQILTGYWQATLSHFLIFLTCEKLAWILLGEERGYVFMFSSKTGWRKPYYHWVVLHIYQVEHQT